MDNQSAQLKKFAVRSLLFAAPVLALAATYFLFDPFQVLYPRTDYYADCHVEPNRDFVSTELYIRNAPQAGYDSFIFGSSRSQSFRAESWKKYLPAGAAPFHFDASDESVYGVWLKLRYLDRQAAPVRHALWILDARLLEQTGGSAQEKTHLYLKHPALSGMGRLRFQSVHFIDYFRAQFFLKYLDYLLFKTWRPYMGMAIYEEPLRYEPARNDRVYPEPDPSDVDPQRYYHEKHKDHFFSWERRRPPVHAPVLGRRQTEYLEKIRALFEKHGTRYALVISPLWDQVRFNPEDLEKLEALFGAGNVHDLSGVNAFTEEVRNYYDVSHFKTRVADEILARIYGNRVE